jgi:hypothetical protein
LLLEQLLVVVEELLLAGRVQLLEYGHDLGVGALTAAAIVLTPADQSSCIVDATSPRRMMGKWQIPAPVSPRLTPRGWQCCVCCRANIFGLHLVLAVGTGVGVTEKEFSITLSQASFSPAGYTFTIQNKGSFSHDLNIQGPGVDTKTSPTLSPGQSGMLTVALQKGSCELWCSVPGHKDKGMDLTIKVG